MRLLVATGNPGKKAEMAQLLAGLPVQIAGPEDFADAPDVLEDGTTLEENAAKKATETARALGVHAVADDSGLFVDALDGRPGVRSSRYVDGEPTSEKLCRKLLSEMAEVPDGQRGAEFRCCIAMADPEGRIALTASGTCRGSITRQMRGEGGFGYDPVFHYEPAGRTFAQMAGEEKNAVSHRGKALREFGRRFRRMIDSQG